MSRKVKDTGKFLSLIANGDDRTTAQKGTPLVTLPDSDGDYRLVIESASQGIVIAQENTIRYANPKVTEFTGFTREELTSRPFIELIYPDDRQIVIRYHEDVLLRKVPSRQLHHRIIDKEGRVKWMEVTGVPFTWEDAPSTLLFISDITERKGIEDRLRQSEEKYRELIEHTGDLIYIMDGQGNFKFINQTMESEYGHYANDLLGKGFRDLITPESYSTAADIFKKQLKGIDVGSVEYELYDRNGRIKTIETKERLVWEGNRIVEVYGIARDVTDRKRAEEALKESEEKYRLVVENAAEVIIVAVEGYLKLYNKKTAEVFGYSEEELISTPIIEFFHPDDRELVLSYRSKREKDKTKPQFFTARMLIKGGATVWMENSVVPFAWRGKRADLVIATDITERKRIEDALRESDEKYRLVVENADEIIGVTTDGILQFVNRKALALFGYAENELVGTPAIDHVHPDDRLPLLRHWRKIGFGKEKKRPFVMRFIGKVGNVIWTENSIVPIQWQGKVAAINIATDITERKRIEDALRESEEKYRLVVENAVEGIAIAYEKELGYVNPLMVEYLGYTREELLERPFIDFIYPDDREEVIKAHLTLMQGSNDTITATRRFIARNGAILWASYTSLPVEWGGQRAVLSFVKDVTENKRILDRLAESEEKHRLVVENADELISVSVDGVLQLVNRKMTLVSSYTEGELIGKPVVDFIHPDDRHLLAEHREKIIRGETPAPLVMRAVSKDGRIVWTENSIVPIQWQGKVAAINIATDITERKRIEDALRESEEKYRLLIENATEGIAITQDRMTRFVNPMLSKLVDYSTEEVMSRSFIDFVHPDDRQMVLEHHIKRTTFEEEPTPYVFRAVSKTGNVVWLENNAVIIDWEGRPATLNFLRDITEQKKIEDVLRESEEKYRLLVENAGEGIAMAQDGVTRFVNPIITRLLGYSAEEITSRPFIDFLHPDDRQMAMDHHIKRTTHLEEPSVYLFRAVTKTGDVVWFENNAVMMDWEGRPATLNFLRDITEQKKIEDALKESEEKYRLVVENAKEIIVITRDGIVQFANNRVMTLFGVPPSILFGKHLSELVIGKDREMLREELGKILTGEEILPYYRYRMRDAKGGIRYIEVNGIPIAWEGQSSLLSFVSDITDRVNAERALQESEAFIRGLVENAPLGILYLDREGTITYENPMSWIITTGMFDETRPSRAVGMNVYDLPGIRDYPESKDVIDKLLSGQSVSNYTLPFTSITGKQTILSVSGAPRIGSDDMLVGAVVQISDITDKVRAEDEIRRRLHYEEALAFCSRELVPLTDLERPMQTIVQHLLDKLDVGGVFICENVMDPIEGLSMLTIAEAIADGYKTPTDLPIPDRFAYKCRSPEMFETLSKGRWYGGPTKDYPPVDRNLLTLIGSRSSITIPIFVTDSFWGFIGFDDYETERVWDEQDILLLQTLSSIIGTAIARKEAKDALAESERRYRELVDSTNDMIYVADYRGTLKYVNAAVRRLGYEPEDLIGKNVYEFYAPSSMEYAQELFRLERTGHQLKSYELDVVRKDGQVRTIEFREDLKWEGDRIVEVYGIGRDVTDRKKMENRLRLVAGSQEAVLNSLRDMVFFTDMTLKITWANRAASQVTGLSIEELVGRFCYEVLHKEDAPCDGCPAIASLSTGRVEKNDSLSCVGKNRRITAYPIPDVLGATSGIAVSIGGLKSRNLFEITEGLSQLDDDIEEDGSSELFLAPLDPNYIYPFSLSIDLQKDTFLITLGWDQYPNEHLLKRLARSESAVARFVYLAARMKTDATGWVDKDVIKAGTMDTNLNKLRSLLEESNVPFLDRFSSRMLIRSDREKKIRLALSASNIEISPGIRNFRSKKHRYMEAVTKRIKTLEREMKKSNQPKEYLISELAIQRQNEANLKKSIEVVETLIGRSLALLKF